MRRRRSAYPVTLGSARASRGGGPTSLRRSGSHCVSRRSEDKTRRPSIWGGQRGRVSAPEGGPSPPQHDCLIPAMANQWHSNGLLAHYQPPGRQPRTAPPHETAIAVLGTRWIDPMRRDLAATTTPCRPETPADGRRLELNGGGGGMASILCGSDEGCRGLQRGLDSARSGPGSLCPSPLLPRISNTNTSLRPASLRSPIHPPSNPPNPSLLAREKKRGGPNAPTQAARNTAGLAGMARVGWWLPRSAASCMAWPFRQPRPSIMAGPWTRLADPGRSAERSLPPQ